MNLCLYWITSVFLLDLKFEFSMNHSLAHLYSQLYFHKQIINSNCAIKRIRGVSQRCISAFTLVVSFFELDKLFQRKPIGIHKITERPPITYLLNQTLIRVLIFCSENTKWNFWFETHCRFAV